MASGNQEAISPRLQQGVSFRSQDFLKSGDQGIRRSGVLDLRRSQVQGLKISGHQGFLTSGDQDTRTSIRIDFLTSLFHDGQSSRFIHSVSMLFCSRCRLREGWFASSDWPANKRERDVIFDPFFESPEHYMFWTQQAVFSVTRNIFGNAKPLARKGRENASEVVVFYRGHGGPTRNFSRQKLFERSSQKQRIF